MTDITIDPRDLARQQIEGAREMLKSWKELDLASYEDCEDRVHVLERLALQDRMSRGMLRLVGSSDVPPCWSCGERKAIGIEFFDYDAFAPPRYKWRLACQPVCENGDCGCDGYFIHWGLLLPHDNAERYELQGPKNWLFHLSCKNWFEASFITELELASKIAVANSHDALRRLQMGHAPRPHNRQSRNVPDKLRSWILERDNFKCRRCNAAASLGARLVVDHVTPVAKGGLTVAENLQTLCWPCNSGKRDRDPHAHDLRQP